MPYWVVTNDRDLLGPYHTSERAQEVCDGLDCPAEVRHTEAFDRSEAVQELRHQRAEKYGATEIHRNFKHKRLQHG